MSLAECSDGSVVFRFGNANEVEKIREKETIKKVFERNLLKESESCTVRAQTSNPAKVDDLGEQISECREDGGVLDTDSSRVKAVSDHTLEIRKESLEGAVSYTETSDSSGNLLALETNERVRRDSVENDIPYTVSDVLNTTNPELKCNNEVDRLSTSSTSDAVSDLRKVCACEDVSKEMSGGKIKTQFATFESGSTIEVPGSYASKKSSMENGSNEFILPPKGDKDLSIDTTVNDMSSERSHEGDVTEVMHVHAPLGTESILNEETSHSVADESVDVDNTDSLTEASPYLLFLYV